MHSCVKVGAHRRSIFLGFVIVSTAWGAPSKAFARTQTEVSPAQTGADPPPANLPTAGPAPRSLSPAGPSAEESAEENEPAAPADGGSQKDPAPGTPAEGEPAATSRASDAPSVPWHQRIEIGAFVDAYYSLNARLPRPNSGVNVYHPYNTNAGFGLAWAGLDVALQPEPVGGSIQVRLGPATPNLALSDFAIPGGVGFLQNAYASFRPGGKNGKFTFLIGKFDTVYGAEVAQSYLNMNYTRGALYNLAQPFFHTGARADYQAFDWLALKVLAVNGWNNTIDNNAGKSFGVSASFTPSDAFGVTLGYMTGPEQPNVQSVTCGAGTSFDGATGACISDPKSNGNTGLASVSGADDRFRHLGDVVVDWRPSERLRLLANGTFVVDQLRDPAASSDRSVLWGGVSLAGRLALNDVFATALRGEVVFDPNGQITLPNTESLNLYTGTWTVEAAPSPHFLLRLDTRVDRASRPVFPTGPNNAENTQVTLTIGVVAKTN